MTGGQAGEWREVRSMDDGTGPANDGEWSGVSLQLVGVGEEVLLGLGVP